MLKAERNWISVAESLGEWFEKAKLKDDQFLVHAGIELDLTELTKVAVSSLTLKPDKKTGGMSNG